MRRGWIGIATVAVALALIGGVYRTAVERNVQVELDQAERDIKAGRFNLARERLTGLATRWPARPEVQYLLGVSEQGRGATGAALDAWARVPAGSPVAFRTALARGRVGMELGRFADAEEAFRVAARDPRPEAAQARHILPLLLGQEGRIDDAMDLIETLWRDGCVSGPQDRIALLHDHIALDFETFPLEGNLAELDRREASKLDDRVWLSRANLAVRTGRFGEAEALLDDCLRRRPDDPVVWRARLDWALAADRVDQVRETLTHLPADRFPSRRLAALHVWLAAHRGDPQAELAALGALVEVDPGNSQALERMYELAIHAHQADRAQEVLRRKAKIDRAKERYNVLYSANHLDADAAEMARLAETLGRRFEAEGFLVILGKRAPDPGVGKAALAPPVRQRLKTGQTLAQLLTAELSSLHADSRSGRKNALGVLPRFQDAAESAGLASFIRDSGGSPIHQLPETMGAGIGVLDYDGDGRLDVYAVQAGPFPDGPFSGDRLFRNRGDGTFADVSEKTGIAGMARGYGHGVTVGDYDNDGDPDLFVTRWRSYALYRNRGDGTFEDVTTQAGFAGDRDWPTSAAFADLDGDGDLDLYVCHYGVWDPSHPNLCKDPSKTLYIACHPREIKALSDHVFLNEHGSFTDATELAGIVDRDGRGLGVVAADLDEDGRIDLYVANDTSANYLFRNLGGLRFEEVAVSAGAAANANGGFQAGMGVTCGDLDGDGLPDISVTNFYDESTTFYQNLGGGLFADRTAAIGLAAPSRYRLGFGIAFLDANNDGRLDLLTSNGHVSDMRPLFPYAMAAQLFLGGEEGRLIDVSERAGQPFQQMHVGRGLAAGDLDNDGLVDAVIISQNEPLALFHNQTAGGGHFVTLRLEGTKSNRDAVGARVTLISGGRRQVAQRVGGGSFLSACDPRLHFGLDTSGLVDSIEVRWPSGNVDRYKDLTPNTGYHLREGDPAAKPLTGFAKPAIPFIRGPELIDTR